MATLNKISLTGYKSVRDCRDLELGRLNVLIGANGSGKSNLLSLFRLLRFAMLGELQVAVGQAGGARSLLYLGPKVTTEIAATLEFETDSEKALYECRLAYTPPGGLFFASEKFRTTPKPGSTSSPSELVVRGASESAVIQTGFRDNERLRWFATLMAAPRSYHFHDTTLASGIRGPRRVEEKRLYPEGENLASVLRFLREGHSREYSNIIETIRLVAPSFGGFILDPQPSSPDSAMLNWRMPGSDYEFGPHQISDGTLRFMALTTLLLQPKEFLPAMIVIDEPELGLHPYAIKLLASMLQDTSNYAQILVATQSPALVDQMEPQDVIVADMVEGASQFHRLDREKLSEWLSDYTLSQMWETNLFGGRP